MLVIGLGARASSEQMKETGMKPDELNEKINAVAQTAGTAKSDAATALMLPTVKWLQTSSPGDGAHPDDFEPAPSRYGLFSCLMAGEQTHFAF